MSLGGTQALRDRARANSQDVMPDTAQTWRPGTNTPTSDFGDSQTFTELDTVNANYWSVSGREAFLLQRLDVKADAIVSLPYNTDITELDQIIYTETETGKIHHFFVSMVFGRSRPFLQRVAVTEYKFDQYA